MTSPHIYINVLDNRDPKAPQPEAIKSLLKPHQLAGLAKAVTMETTGAIIAYSNLQLPGTSSTLALTHSSSYSGSEDEEDEEGDEGAGTGTGAGPPTPAQSASQDQGETVRVRSNMGIIGDIVGYGKTLTALAIIASVPHSNIFVEPTIITSNYTSSSYNIIEKNWSRNPATDYMIPTTLVVVPRGPVFVQWETTIRRQTTLTVLAIDKIGSINGLPVNSDSSNEEVRAFFGGFDVVLVKDTMIKKLFSSFNSSVLSGWSRIMTDEAHQTLWSTPFLRFRFLWMITATYKYIISGRHPQRSQLSHYTRGLTITGGAASPYGHYSACPCIFDYLIIRGEYEFVKSSFNVPAYEEKYYTCVMAARLQAVMPFLSRDVQEQLNANDVAGAIRAMGGNSETETNIVRLITSDIEREISNKQKEIDYVSSLELPADVMALRMKTLRTAMERLVDKQAAIIERVTELTDKVCAICYDSYENPTMLDCTHVFCGRCIMDWVVMKKHLSCPQCRATVSHKFVQIVSDAAVASAMAKTVESNSGEGSSSGEERILSKVDRVMDIIRRKPAGKFLIFSSNDSSFYEIKSRLDLDGISNTEMKGATSVMMCNLEKFRSGVHRVVLLNTHHAGSGIDISCATDVIIFHKMDDAKTQAVGRAQRVGRTSKLTVHNICYAHEMPGN